MIIFLLICELGLHFVWLFLSLFLVVGLRLLLICCFVLVSSLLCELLMASTTLELRVTKSFAQALTNSCNIPTSQLPKPCLKGGQISIRIPEDGYLIGILDFQNVLNMRFILQKGSSLVHMVDLKDIISKFRKTNGP